MSGRPAQPTDRELVIAARAGSRPALEALVRRYQRPVYFLCHGYVHDHDLASDLSQRAFLKALVNLETLRDTELFRGWLFRIAANLSRNQLRDGARFVREEGLDSPVAAQAEAFLEAAERAEGLRGAVARLAKRQRRVVELRVYHELTFSQIARALHITENAAKVTFHHAGKRLRSLLDPGTGRGG